MMVIYMVYICKHNIRYINQSTLEQDEEDQNENESNEEDKKKKKKKREAAKKSLEVVGAESFPEKKGVIKKKSVEWSSLFGLDRKKKSLYKRQSDDDYVGDFEEYGIFSN